MPIVFGGESDAALRRAARLGDGWLGTWHTPESVRRVVARLWELRAEAGRPADGFEITVMVDPRKADQRLFRGLAAAGVHRACVASPEVAASEWPELLDRLEPVVSALRPPATVG